MRRGDDRRPVGIRSHRDAGEGTGGGAAGALAEGIHACLSASEHPRCLVLSVDTPLVPASILARLCQTHTGGVTVLRRGEKQEPLMGVYDRALAPTMSELIAEGGKPVRALSGCVKWNMLDYLGPEVFLKNCNTPADFTQVEEIFTLFARQGIVL